MLIPGHRMIERAGALHFYDGRRLVSMTAPQPVRTAIVALSSLLFNAPSDLHSSDLHSPNLHSSDLHSPDTDSDKTSSAASWSGTRSEAHHQHRDLEQVSEVLQLGPDGARELLDLMMKLSVIDPRPVSSIATASALDGAAHFCSGQTGGWLRPDDARARLEGHRVLAVGAHADLLCSELVASGLRAETASMPQLGEENLENSVVVAGADEDGSLAYLPELNDLALRRRFNWLPLGDFDGEVIRVGPLIVPGSTACFTCTLTRLAANVEYSTLYADLVVRIPAAPAPAAVRSWTNAVVSLVLLRWLGNRDHGVPGVLHTLVARDLTVRSARVHPVPRCVDCRATDHVPAAAPWEMARDS